MPLVTTTLRRAPWWNWLYRLVLALTLAAALTVAPGPRAAQAFTTLLTVNQAGDTPGLPCAGGASPCNLRSAVNIAETDGVNDDIGFSANFTIVLSSTLILSAPGTTIAATPSQVVEIDGNGGN